MRGNIQVPCRAAMPGVIGIRSSTASVGEAYDEALTEASFATREGERHDRRHFLSKTKVRMAVFAFIEGYHDPKGPGDPPGIELTGNLIAMLRAGGQTIAPRDASLILYLERLLHRSAQAEPWTHAHPRRTRPAREP